MEEEVVPLKNVQINSQSLMEMQAEKEDKLLVPDRLDFHCLERDNIKVEESPDVK